MKTINLRETMREYINLKDEIGDGKNFEDFFGFLFDKIGIKPDEDFNKLFETIKNG